MDGTGFSFPLPSQIDDVPGAEGWRSMYQYFTRFQPADDSRFWFNNAMHFPEPLPVFDVLTCEIPYAAIGANTARIFAFPTTRGIEHRILNGRVYITAIPVTDPAEIERRLAVFTERAGYYYQNWDHLLGLWQDKMTGLIAEIGAVTVPELPELDDPKVVFDATGVAQNHYVRENWHRCIDLYSKMWHHHTEFLMLGYGAYVVFFEFCKKAFPEIPDQAVARMVAGIEVIMYRPDDELKKLARLAVECGVDELFTEGCSPDEVLHALTERGDSGRRWVRLVREGDPLIRPTERLLRERDDIVARYRALLPSDDERAAFDQMLGLSRQVFPYVEDHKWYCEHWFTSVFYAKIRQFGDLLVRRGVLAEVEDLFHLHHTEIDQALSDVMLAWAAGSPTLGAAHFGPIIAERKRMLKVLKGWSAPPAIGPVPEALNDPAVRMLWGVTAETLATWAAAEHGDGQEIHGYAAAPGVVEGVARVLRSVNDIGQIRDGEILVCAVTAPSWAPVFGKIIAAVSDIGGTMSHAAIVAREYGMPAVVGTGHATKLIKTGYRVQVDGDRGVVRILA